MSLQEWKEEFENRRILIWGYGREGQSSYRLIRRVCPTLPLQIAESRQAAGLLKQAADSTVHTECKFDDTVDFQAFDLILKSPGIVVPAALRSCAISGQSPLFLKHYAARTIGVTGTKGKSTTTSLIAAALRQKYPVHLVGNIGTACFEAIEQMGEDDLTAFEISCHQLEFSPYSPHVAVLLNLYEEHLDHYGTMAAYTAAKENIFLHQKPGDTVILSQDLKPQIAKASQPVLIGRDITAEGKVLRIPGHQLDAANCSLIGEHNYRNLAVAAYIACDLYGVSEQQFLQAAAAFQPLPHRLQDLGEINGIRYVNDSISTIGQSCIQALESLPATDTVLIGGMDRGIEYRELETYLMQHPQLHVIFMYASGRRVYEELMQQHADGSRYCLCSDLAQAVSQAKQLTRPHHICLLSPAASSYDHFKNFEQRGEVFESLVRQ